MSKEIKNKEEGNEIKDPNQLELDIKLDTDPSYWNYRVLKYKLEDESDAFGIHEVQYNVNGDVIEVSDFPTEVFGASIDDLKEGIEKIAGALEKDIIDTTKLESETNE
jgi:hypothetical protein